MKQPLVECSTKFLFGLAPVPTPGTGGAGANGGGNT